MKEKTLQRIFIVCFLLLCLLPSVGMLVFGETEPVANEILAQRPRLTVSGKLNKNVLSDLTDYIADRFALRREFVNAWAVLNAGLFHTSAEDQVVLGTDGWLYYAPTLDDYMGRALSDEELDLAARNLAAIQAYAEERNATFLFTIAPNKNSLYPGNMPGYIPSGHASSNAVKIVPYLERYGVNYVDLFEVFNAEDEVLYYRTDSHWNDRGAALAADSLLAASGREGVYSAGPFAPADAHRGDLYDMLFPLGTDTEEAESYAGFRFTTRNNPNGGNAMKIETECADGEGVLLCWRDSFGISLYPYLADSFSEALFLRSGSYDLSMIDEFGADVVLIELVERDLYRIASDKAFSTP